MKYTQVTKQSQIENALAGIKATLETVNGSVSRVVLCDENGGSLVVDYVSYSMRVMRPAQPTLVDRFRLHGKWKGLDVSEVFESKYAAEQRRNDIEDHPSAYALAIDPIKVDEDAEPKAGGDPIAF